MHHAVVEDGGLVEHLHGDGGARVGVDRELDLGERPTGGSGFAGARACDRDAMVFLPEKAELELEERCRAACVTA